jgi:hypothetical protein
MNTAVKVVFALIGILVLGGILVAMKSSQDSTQSSFVPNSNNDKRLIVSGLSQQELGKVLSDFQSMYAGRLHRTFSIHLTPISSNQFRIQFPNDIEPMYFHFLINYVRYPKGLDLSARSILVVGRATLDNQFNIPSASLIGQKAMIYIPANDKDFDLVYIQTDHGQTFEDSFASSSWKQVQNPRMPSGIETLK